MEGTAVLSLCSPAAHACNSSGIAGENEVQVVPLFPKGELPQLSDEITGHSQSVGR